MIFIGYNILIELLHLTHRSKEIVVSYHIIVLLTFLLLCLFFFLVISSSPYFLSLLHALHYFHIFFGAHSPLKLYREMILFGQPHMRTELSTSGLDERSWFSGWNPCIAELVSFIAALLNFQFCVIYVSCSWLAGLFCCKLFWNHMLYLLDQGKP